MDDFKKDLVIAYDLDARRRSRNVLIRDDWKILVRKKFLDLLKNENKNTLLEIGAGIGTDAKYFKDNGLEVLAIDISEGMINEARNLGVNAKVMDLYDINKLGQTFDAIYSMNVMLHVPRKDLRLVLTKIKEVLNPNGLFYYGTYGGVTEELVLNSKKTNFLPRFFSKLSDEDLLIETNMFKKVSFEIIEVNNPDQQGYHYQSLVLRND